MNKDKVIAAYQKAINNIDDWFEYAYAGASKETSKDVVMEMIDNLNEELVALSKEP